MRPNMIREAVLESTGSQLKVTMRQAYRGLCASKNSRRQHKTGLPYRRTARNLVHAPTTHTGTR